MEVHHFTIHIQKRVQELQEWTTIKNEEEQEEQEKGKGKGKGKEKGKMKEKGKEKNEKRPTTTAINGREQASEMTLASLRPPQLVNLIESVWKARDDSEEAQKNLDLFLVEQRRERAFRRRRAAQTSGGSKRLQELQRKACVKAATYNSLVCQLARVAVTHFPELLVAPPVHGGRGIGESQNYAEEEEEEEEEESAALWHLLHDACKSDGLKVAGRRVQHYTDVVRLATAGCNARHDVYPACLLRINNNAPNSGMPVVLKKYVLQSDDTTTTPPAAAAETAAQWAGFCRRLACCT